MYVASLPRESAHRLSRHPRAVRVGYHSSTLWSRRARRWFWASKATKRVLALVQDLTIGDGSAVGGDIGPLRTN
jgi:hypothetical protein